MAHSTQGDAMARPIPDPNPIDVPGASGDAFREDELIGTTGDEDFAWEEGDAQGGEDADPLTHPEEADAAQATDEQAAPEGAVPKGRLDREAQVLIDDPQASREVNRSLQNGVQEIVDPMEPG